MAVIVSYPFLLGSGGYGTSPLLFLFFSAVFAIIGEGILSSLLRNRKRLYLCRAALLLVLGIGTLVVGRASSNIDGPATFEKIAGVKPSSSVTGIQAWEQWYDGENWLVKFTCDESDAIALATQMHMEKQYEAASDTERAAPDRVSLFLLMPFFDMSRVELPMMRAPQYWEKGGQGSNGLIEDRKLLYDPATRCGVLLMYKD